METEIINLYLNLLKDMNLVFAVLVTWAITHGVKQMAFIKHVRRRSDMVLRTRLVAMVAGVITVLFFKRFDGDLSATINLAVLVGFCNPFLYKLCMWLLAKFLPQVDGYLSNDKPGDNK